LARLAVELTSRDLRIFKLDNSEYILDLSVYATQMSRSLVRASPVKRTNAVTLKTIEPMTGEDGLPGGRRHRDLGNSVRGAITGGGGGRDIKQDDQGLSPAPST
jgi:hypothetical protein